MTPEEFKKKYDDTHEELQISGLIANGLKGGNLVKSSPGDKNITKFGKIPGKALIEAKSMKDRKEGLAHCLLDACAARYPELMDVRVDKLFELALKALPQQLDQHIDVNFTFAEFVKKATLEKAETETVDV